RPRDPLRAALAVVPRQYQRNHEAQREQAEDNVHRAVRPVVASRHDIQHLDQRERECDVGQRPLHQLALLQTRDEFGHGEAPLVAADCAPEYFLSNAWNRGSLRKGSHTGPSFRRVTLMTSPAGIASSWPINSSAWSFAPAWASTSANPAKVYSPNKASLEMGITSVARRAAAMASVLRPRHTSTHATCCRFPMTSGCFASSASSN